MSGHPAGIGFTAYPTGVPQRPQNDLVRFSDDLKNVRKESELVASGWKISLAGIQGVLLVSSSLSPGFLVVGGVEAAERRSSDTVT